MATAAAGAGSVWNANSWHWEEKNYSRWSREYLQQRFAAGTPLATAEHFSIETAGDVEMHGDVSVSVRKQKLILAVDISLSFSWEAFRTRAAAAAAAQNGGEATAAAVDTREAAAAAEGRRSCCRGKIKVEDLSVDSIQDADFACTVSLQPPAAASSEAATEQERQQCLQLVRKNSKNLLQQVLTQYIADLRQAEADAERLAADKRRREEELQRAKAAEDARGNEKQQIAAEERERDRLFKEKEKKRVAAAAAEAMKTSQTGPLEGQGSVWNASSYHWEEKPMTSWCQETLKERLSSAVFKLLDNSTALTFFNVSVEGEASNTIRKGRKIVIFDLTIGADWTATARDDAGVFLADSRGRLEINDFTSETADDYQLSIRGDGKVPPQQRIDAAAKKELPALLHDLLKQFIEDLKARG